LFQADDGIRDVERSRWLGEVYKRHELEARMVPAKDQVEALREPKDQLDERLKRLIVESQQPSRRDTLGPEMRRARAALISLRGY